MKFPLLCCLLFAAFVASAAEPDWPEVERNATGLLQRYVRLASINPPADTRETARLFQSALSAGGIEAHIYETASPGKVNLIARLPGRDPSRRALVLLNHMDVVPVDAARWKQDPFGAQIEGGDIWGRGTLDMKSTGIMQLTALLLLKQLAIVPARDIVFVATCDEETGGVNGASWMIAHHWSEMNPEYVLDEGGVGSRDLYAPGKLVFGVSVIDKQVLWLRLRAQGTSGHGSQPVPDNANDLLITAIQKARELPASDRASGVVNNLRDTLGVLASNKFVNAIQRNTMSLTSLRSGLGNPPKANVIPSLAEATLDCRLLPGQNADEFVSEIKARINDPRISVERISPEPDDPHPSSTATPLYAAIQKAIRAHHPDAAVAPIVVPFGTDGQKFRLRNIPAYGMMPMIIDTATLATMHSDSEHIPLDQFRMGLRIYFDLLRSDY